MQLNLTKAQNGRALSIDSDEITDIRDEIGCSIITMKDGTEHHAYESPASVRVMMGGKR